MATTRVHTDTAKAAVARAVVEALTEAGISRLDASERTGIPRSTFYRKADGIGKAFDIDELAAIATLLNTTPAALVARAEGCAA